jgi:prepilin-type N-terminal cleavage/methylation domain-containing protein
MTRRGQATPPRAARPGFTLVEMLVVIAIIAVLAGLASVAYFRWIDTQRQDNTENTMRTVSQALQRHMEAVRASAQTETIPPFVLNNIAGGDALRARVIWVKLRLKQEFPITFAEARNPGDTGDPNTSLPAGVLPGKYGALASASAGGGESAACLYMALRKTRKGVQPEELPSSAVADTNSDGLPEIVDGWGKPLTFVRWPTDPTGNVAWVQELNSKNPASNPTGLRNADPIDKDGTLLDAAWYAGGGRVYFEALCHQVSPPNAAGQKAYYMLPTLISAGLDGAFGTADDIYSFRLVLGARGSQP